MNNDNVGEMLLRAMLAYLKSLDRCISSNLEIEDVKLHSIKGGGFRLELGAREVYFDKDGVLDGTGVDLPEMNRQLPGVNEVKA